MALQVPLAGSYSSALVKAPPLYNSPCHQHLAVGQQRRRVIVACGVEAARGTPGPAGRVVQFRAAKIAAATDRSPCHQHLAVGQQRRRVIRACGVEAARGTPRPAGRVVQFRAAKRAAATDSPCHQHLAVGQQRRRVIDRVRC